MNNDVLSKILTRIYSDFGVVENKYEILSTKIDKVRGNDIILIKYKYNGIIASWNILYSDYSNELQKTRDTKIGTILE
jgi:hypothetical protein